MRILHVVPTYLPAVRHGGPIRAVHGLAKALVARGHEVVVFTTDQHGDDRLEVPIDRPVPLDGVTVRYFRAESPWRLARAPAMGAALDREAGSFEAMHLHSIFLWPTSRAARAAEVAARPWLVSPRGMLVPELFARRGTFRKRLWLRFVERRTLERAARLVATTALEAREAGRFGLRLPPIELLANGVDLAEPVGEAGSTVRTMPGAPPYFLYLGRLSWKKSLDVLVEAMAEVDGARLIFAGNDDEGLSDRLLRLAASAGIASRFELAGFVDGERKRALLAGARALVLPSISENFGNVVLEAWAEGTPVVVSAGVGLAEEVAACAGGEVTAANPAALAASLRRLRDDGAGACRAGENGRRRVRERFSWPAIAASAEAIYEKVVAERRGE